MGRPAGPRSRQPSPAPPDFDGDGIDVARRRERVDHAEPEREQPGPQLLPVDIVVVLTRSELPPVNPGMWGPPHPGRVNALSTVTATHLPVWDGWRNDVVGVHRRIKGKPWLQVIQPESRAEWAAKRSQSFEAGS